MFPLVHCSVSSSETGGWGVGKRYQIHSTFIIKEWDCEHIWVFIHFENFGCLLMGETPCRTALSQQEKALQTLVGSDSFKSWWAVCFWCVCCACTADVPNRAPHPHPLDFSSCSVAFCSETWNLWLCMETWLLMSLKRLVSFLCSANN